MKRSMENRIRKAFAEEKEVSEQAVDRMILLARMQWKAAGRKKRIGFMELLLAQFRFIGWKMWLLELFLTFVPTFVVMRYANLHVITPAKAAFCLSCLVIGISMFWMIFIYRSSYYQMMEIEAASFFSIKRLLLSRILILSAGELAAIAGISAVTSRHGILGFENGMIYMLFFLGVCSNGILVLFRKTKIEKMCRYFFVYGGLLLAAMMLTDRFRPQFFGGTLKMWMIPGCCILAGYCIYQCFLLLKQSEEKAYV